MKSGVQLLGVTEGVWCFRQRSYVCRSSAVVNDEGVVLVDTGMTSDAEPVLNGLAILGRAPAAGRPRGAAFPAGCRNVFPSAATSTAMSADVLVRDGDLVLGQFRVVETPWSDP